MSTKFRDRTAGPSIARDTDVQANAAADNARDTQTRTDLGALIQSTENSAKAYADNSAGAQAANVMAQLNSEIGRALSAETNLQSQINTHSTNIAANSSAITNETSRAQGAESANTSSITSILARLNSSVIPPACDTSMDSSAGTSTTAAKADHIHEINIITLNAVATTDTTTTASTNAPAVMNGMTLTPGPGTYVVLFGTALEHSNQNASITCSIYAGGVQVPGSARPVICRPNSVGANSLSLSVFSFSVSTVSGGQTIEGRWGTSVGTATAHTRSLLLIKVA